jgi:uroporphyrin-III C-methyltransferase/precorrin-2 dehydrogenase/sirohydrochlorin ferrochelatase
VELLVAAGCDVAVIAPRVHENIRAAGERNDLRWIAREFAAGDCRGYQLVVAATGSREVNRAAFDEASSLCIPVNVVDDPELCTVHFPAVWRQGSLTMAFSTGGGAPFMAAAVRDRISRQGPPLARWVDVAAKFRSVVRSEIADWEEKNRLYSRFVDSIRPGYPPDPPEEDRLSDWMVWLENLGERKG